MTKRIKHGGQLVHQSLRVVKNQKKLIVFPLAASIITLILLAFIVTPITTYEKTQIALHKNQAHVIVWAYVIVLLFLFVTHQVAIHFMAAMTHCVNQHFKGKPVKLSEGIKAANSHFIQLYNWNSYAGTIGIVINLTQRFLRPLSFYQKMFQGLRWIIATYLVIPVIMANKTGPVKSIKRSAELIRKTWGINLRPQFGFLPLLLLARFLTLIPLIIGLIKGGHQNILIGTAITVALVILVTTVSSITRTIIACVLHNYAAEGVIAPEFDEKLIKKAFVERSN